MTIQRRTLIQLGLAAMAVGGLAAPLAAGPAAANPVRGIGADAAGAVPRVVPALKEFDAAGTDRLVLTARGSIVAQGAAAETGRTLAGDLAQLTPLRLPVRRGAARGGDIELRIDPGLRHEAGGVRFAEEGYVIEVGDRVVITAATTTGLYWATRTILQQLVGTPDRTSLLTGRSVDWPDHPKRGFMLDVARRFYSVEVLRDYINLLSWFKCNEFQIHLMDNGFLEPGSGDWSTVQRAFRLETANPALQGLTATDGSYSRAQWDGLEDLAAERSVRLIPEIEGPAHALSITGWKPELGLPGGQFDHLDLAKPEATALMKQIYDEFVPWFRGTDVHVGVDEYHADAELFRVYYNEIVGHLEQLGKQPRCWGSFTEMSQGADGYDKGVIVNCWNNSWYDMASAVADGFEFLNTNDGILYVVPFADYYHGHGLANQDLYENFVPHRAGSVEVAPGAPLGAMWAVWNDLTREDYDEFDVHPMIELSFAVLAQKNWTAAAPTSGYRDFLTTLGGIGLGPGRTVITPQRVGFPGDLALGAAVTSSAAVEGHRATAVNDREPHTLWVPGDQQAWLQLDLGQPQRLGNLELEWGPGQRIDAVVRCSTDGATWDTVAEVRGSVAALDVVPVGRRARHLRIERLRSAGAPPTVQRVSVFADPGIAVGKPVTSSGVEAGTSFVAENVVDGSRETRWSANNSGVGWVAVDLQQQTAVAEVVLAWEAASARDFSLQASTNGTDWTTLETVTGAAAGERVDTFAVDGRWRWLKVEVTARSMAPHLSLREFEVH